MCVITQRASILEFVSRPAVDRHEQHLDANNKVPRVFGYLNVEYLVILMLTKKAILVCVSYYPALWQQLDLPIYKAVFVLKVWWR